MQHSDNITTKKNVSQFDKDVQQIGSYAYTAERLSSRIANARVSECIANAYEFKNKKVLDLGCGDGTYTLEFSKLGVKRVVGVDPAIKAIEVANTKAKELGLDTTVEFEVGNIYEMESYLNHNQFDCIVLRGVLHHLPDPASAVMALGAFNGTIIIVEPNGNNPILKLIEKYSRYHVAHEERSFSPSLVSSWLTRAGFQITASSVFNLVPFFCPDWMVSLLRIIGMLVEHLPLLRNIACGQSLIVAHK